MARKRKRSDDGPVAPAPESTGQIRHKTLSAYYPYLYSLLTFLAVTLGYPEDDLVKEDDGETYKSMLLSSIVASRLPAVPKSGPAEPPRVLTRQPETIDRILHALSSGNGSGNSTRKRNNCLTLGYLSRDRTRATNRNRPAVEHQMLNSSVAELRTWEWRILHGRCGSVPTLCSCQDRHPAVHRLVGGECHLSRHGTGEELLLHATVWHATV